MIKLRIMGKTEDLEWITSILEEHEKVEVTQQSKLFRIQRSTRFFRKYMELERKDQDKESADDV